MIPRGCTVNGGDLVVVCGGCAGKVGGCTVMCAPKGHRVGGGGACAALSAAEGEAFCHGFVVMGGECAGFAVNP